jgi:hypothetical protein
VVSEFVVVVSEFVVVVAELVTVVTWEREKILLDLFGDVSLSDWFFFWAFLSWQCFIGQLVTSDPMSDWHLCWTEKRLGLGPVWAWGPSCKF